MANQRKVREGRRLAYYGHAADSNYWGAHWQMYGHATDGDGSIRGIKNHLLRYLPTHGKILEAGCGLGQVVMALRAMGYDIEGVEFSPETVETVLAGAPEVPISVGDVTDLQVADGHYNAYVSLGVVEHRQAGPEPFLLEAYRVLSPQGIAFFGVPYFNPLRRMKGRLGFYQHEPSQGMPFYQYAYSPSEFTDLLRVNGFEVIDRTAYSALKGAKDEVPAVRLLLELGRRALRRNRSRRPAGEDAGSGGRVGPSEAGRHLADALERPPFTALAHMMLFVCTKRTPV